MPHAFHIIIADNQAITRMGIKAYAQQVLILPKFEQARTKKELIELLCRYPDAMVVLDYTTLDFTGIEDFLILYNRFDSVTWLLFSSTLSETFIRRITAEKNVGVLFKDCEVKEIRDSLQEAAHGNRYLCRQVKALLNDSSGKDQSPTPLTPAETEILKLITQGNSVKEIAEKRNSSTHTIITHKKNIFSKLGVNNVHEATRYALRAGLVELMEYYI